ncbi:MAG: phosphatidylcholine/phosphatidylserine synthase [Planctomycetota bacterium]|nr:MAG: phosphatidylcholine/phosphatidylserine synthase [Planctomycetota bacterium]
MSEPHNLQRVSQRRGIGRIKELPVLPTLFTAGNLASGVTAILCAAHNMLGIGAALVFVAMICDLLDGKVARMTGTDGAFGAELDSLADIVSFGVAPAMLLHRLVLGDSGVWGQGERIIWLVTIVYVVFTAIRLARYNVEIGDGPTNMFKGLPSPGAAAVLCSWILLYGYLGSERGGNVVFEMTFMASYFSLEQLGHVLGIALMFLGLLMAVLMVSAVPFPHLGKTLLTGRLGFRSLVIMVLLIGSLIVWHVYALALVTTAYVLFSLVPGLRSLLLKRRTHQGPIINESATGGAS